MTGTDCGCGCGGTSNRPAVFTRPRFFPGQLLTEEDLTLLVDYVTGKQRLHNRSVLGPGVVCGLEVDCDPCGGGTVEVRPGHALDCAGNDIVVSCKEKVDVGALVRELRVSSLGVDCDRCEEDGDRRYGLFVHYDEQPVDPVAPYATEQPCPTPGCVPSRIREGLRFAVRCASHDDHRYNPGTRLLAGIGDLDRFHQIQRLARRLGHYLDPAFATLASPARPVLFEGADEVRFTTSLAELAKSGDGQPAPPQARALTEHVRALAASLARYDTHDDAAQRELRARYPALDRAGEARQVLGAVCARLASADQEQVWPDPVYRGLAAAVLAETVARVVPEPPDAQAPLEVRLLANGTPLDNVLAVVLRADLAEIREWLLGRLERAPGVADCRLRAQVRAADLPQPLPVPEPDSSRRLTAAELAHLAEAARDLTIALHRFVADTACSTLNPPCVDCGDSCGDGVLLAHLELDGCDVLRVCSATREQVLPGGSAYGEWLPKLYRLRELAERLCCQPVPVYQPPAPPPQGPVPRPYLAGLLAPWPRTGDLEQLLSLLLTPAPGETPPRVLHEQVYTVPSDVTDSLRELNVLRDQVSDLTATVGVLRAALEAATEQVGQVRAELPDRLGSRLADLESAPAEAPPTPPARRPRAQKPRPRSGESS